MGKRARNAATARVGCFLLVVTTCVCVSGCVDIYLELDFREDGTALYKASFETDRRMADLLAGRKFGEGDLRIREFWRGDRFRHEETAVLGRGWKPLPVSMTDEQIRLEQTRFEHSIAPLPDSLRRSLGIQLGSLFIKGHFVVYRVRFPVPVARAFPCQVGERSFWPTIDGRTATWQIPLSLVLVARDQLVFRVGLASPMSGWPKLTRWPRALATMPADDGELSQPAARPIPPESLHIVYEPELRFHGDSEHGMEQFFPMDAGDYLRQCTLAGASQEDFSDRPEGWLSLDTLSILSQKFDTRAWHFCLVSSSWLQRFIETRPARIGPTDWRARYFTDALLEYHEALDGPIGPCVYYVRKFIEPDFGYLVLQYWFFYAFNSHGCYVDIGNVHEGDWESIMIFLDPNVRRPIYAAYSAHDNKGTTVLRNWGPEEIEIVDGTHPVVYVALGSHASYFVAGGTGLLYEHSEEEGLRRSDRKATYDLHNGKGLRILPGETNSGGLWWQTRHVLEDMDRGVKPPDWALRYQGRWGRESILPESLGSSGPRFGPSADFEKWYRPAKWAGIAQSPPSLAAGK